MQLKPVSKTMREFLALIGETPEEHQKQVMLLKSYKSSNSTQKALRELNAEYERKRGARAPVSELAQRAEFMAKPIEVWIPVAYVIYARRNFCKHCNDWAVCMDSANIFLDSRRKNDASKARHLVPVKTIEHANLPHLVETVVTHTPFCLNCFNEKKEQINAA